jgi:predicted transcriptional regulator
MPSLLHQNGSPPKLRKDKRHKLQLFYEILTAIEDDRISNGAAKPTRIQHFSRMSYDKMMNHMSDLEIKGMIYRDDNGLISITSKGQKYVKQYSELITLVEGVTL